ncbi:MAG: hypothetical protein SOW41_05825 [Anaerococcus sp.]|nr:hypothetical protein [Peptoniphilaceae bacterium]MDY3055568.1 hypothetical protein [Anaerococcus sp.]
MNSNELKFLIISLISDGILFVLIRMYFEREFKKKERDQLFKEDNIKSILRALQDLNSFCMESEYKMVLNMLSKEDYIIQFTDKLFHFITLSINNIYDFNHLNGQLNSWQLALRNYYTYINEIVQKDVDFYKDDRRNKLLNKLNKENIDFINEIRKSILN